MIIRLLIVITTFFISNAFATPTTCPINLTQDSKGFFTSNDPPGWKSTESKPLTVTLEAKDFGGVVYSPEKKRIACVYKDSAGAWVVLLSNIEHPFEKEDLKGAPNIWELNEKYQDYECGTPNSTLNDCLFEVK